jgi:hypothetical protein
MFALAEEVAEEFCEKMIEVAHLFERILLVNGCEILT